MFVFVKCINQCFVYAAVTHHQQINTVHRWIVGKSSFTPTEREERESKKKSRAETERTRPIVVRSVQYIILVLCMYTLY